MRVYSFCILVRVLLIPLLSAIWSMPVFACIPYTKKEKIMHSKKTDLRTSQKRRFTLIELLVVISIISILATLILPSFGGIKSSAKLIQCMNNQRSLYMAFTMYNQDYDSLPIRTSDDGNCYIRKSSNGYISPWFGWLYQHKYVTNPELFFCPDLKSPDGALWETDWSLNSKDFDLRLNQNIDKGIKTGYDMSKIGGISETPVAGGLEAYASLKNKNLTSSENNKSILMACSNIWLEKDSPVSQQAGKEYIVSHDKKYIVVTKATGEIKKIKYSEILKHPMHIKLKYLYTGSNFTFSILEDLANE